jgi:hypothetical protein
MFSRINLFYATHQLFRLAGARRSRYSSVFLTSSVETSRFNSQAFVLLISEILSVHFEGD